MSGHEPRSLSIAASPTMTNSGPVLVQCVSRPLPLMTPASTTLIPLPASAFRPQTFIVVHTENLLAPLTAKNKASQAASPSNCAFALLIIYFENNEAISVCAKSQEESRIRDKSPVAVLHTRKPQTENDNFANRRWLRRHLGLRGQ